MRMQGLEGIFQKYEAGDAQRQSRGMEFGLDYQQRCLHIRQ